MPDYIIRDYRPEDAPRLKALWKLAFGDGDAYIDSYFEKFVREDACVVAEADGIPVSAMYVMPGIRLYPFRRNVLTAGYAYALATLPEYRGRGIGSAVYKAANDRALETADAALVRPAEPGLFPFYENVSGAKPLGGMREGAYAREELQGLPKEASVRIPGWQYAGIREIFLSELPHATFPEELYDHLEENGTEFYMMEKGAAAAETENGVCRIIELLSPSLDHRTAAASVARWRPAQTYTVRTPVFFDGPGGAKPYVLSALKSPPGYPLPDDFWWGFGLD